MHVNFSSNRPLYSPAIRFGSEGGWGKPVDLEDIVGKQEGPKETQQPPADTVEKRQPSQPTAPVTDPQDVKAAAEKGFVTAESILQKVQNTSEEVEIAHYETRMRRINEALKRFQEDLETDPRNKDVKNFLAANPHKLWDMFAQANPTQASEMAILLAEKKGKEAQVQTRQEREELRAATAEALRDAKEAAKHAAANAARAVGEAVQKAPAAIVEGVAKAREMVDEVREAAKSKKQPPADSGAPGESATDETEAPAEKQPDLSPPSEPPAEDTVQDKARKAVDDFKAWARNRRKK